MSSLAILPVDEGRVDCHPIVPDNHSAILPFYTTLKVLINISLTIGMQVSLEKDPYLTQSNMVIQELQEILAFFLLEAHYVSRELGVHIQSLLTCRWMSSHDRMNGPARC